MKSHRLLPLLILLLASPPAGLRGENIDVRGSDFIPAELVDALREFAHARGDEFTARMDGSLLAFSAFEDGKADIILVAMPDEDPESFPYPVIPLGFQTTVVAVNAQNPLDALTADQLRGIFGSGGQNVIARWGDVGLTENWRNRSILPTSLSVTVGPAIGLFSHLILEGRPYRENVQTFQSNLRVEAYLLNNEGSIGVLSTVPVSESLKTVRIEDPETRVPFGPTIENINYGDYPLALPYFICVPNSQFRSLAPYIAFLMSDEVAAILARNEFTPLLEPTRQQVIARLPAEE